MYLDIDHFKRINDSLGHAVGDLLLKDFAQRLAYCVRGVDTVARVGGDEFAVILEELERRDDGCRIAAKIVREMRPEFPLEEHTVEITTSVGIAFHDGKEALGADQLLRNADAALYQAKNSGRNAYQVAA
jgi:diguanylate cyclase (GGDEF)-like protein